MLARRIALGDRLAWHAPTGYATARDPLRFASVDPHLYNGKMGIALFLAALARVTGVAEYGEVSLEAISGLRRRLGGLTAEPQSLPHLPVGALIGVASFIYGFLHIGKLLDKPELVDEAHQITALLSAERIARDQRVWIQVGSAGALLVMFALEREISQPNCWGRTPRDIALLCGEQILVQRTVFDGRPAAWLLSPGKPPLGGFSYGAAGVVYALLRLYSVCGDPRLLTAAQEGLQFIRSLFAPELGVWLDMRQVFQQSYTGPRNGEWMDWWSVGGELVPRAGETGKPRPPVPSARFLGMWCHGAPGMLLALLAAREILPSGDLERESALALSLVQACSQSEQFLAEERDDVCCGHSGRILVLQHVAERLGRPDLLAEAGMLATRMLERAQRAGGFQFSCARGTDAYSPSLFQGAAGVGYALLRLARPAELPCFLVLQ